MADSSLVRNRISAIFVLGLVCCSVAGCGNGERAQSSNDRIPSDARRLTVASVTDWYGHAKSTRIATIDSAAEVRAVAQLLNGLPLQQPGIGSCPVYGSAVHAVKLTFYSSGTSTSAVAAAGFLPRLAGVTLARCGGNVGLKLPGKTPLSLDPLAVPGPSTPFVRRIDTILGLQLPTS